MTTIQLIIVEIVIVNAIVIIVIITVGRLLDVIVQIGPEIGEEFVMLNGGADGFQRARHWMGVAGGAVIVIVVTDCIVGGWIVDRCIARPL